jgi:hypothetical protein
VAAVAQAHALARDAAVGRELIQADLGRLDDKPTLARVILLTALAGVELASGDTTAARRACPTQRGPASLKGMRTQCSRKRLPPTPRAT